MSQVVYIGVAMARTGGAAPVILADLSSPDRSPRGTDVKAVLAKVATTFSNTITEPQERYVYHVKVDAPFAPNSSELTLVFVCVTEAQFDKQDAINRLDALKGVTRDIPDLSRKGKNASGGEKVLQFELEPVLVKLMNDSGTSGDSDRLSALRAQVNEVKTVMISNVDRVLDRGERLGELEARSADLETSSNAFQRSARQVRRQMCCRNLKCNLIMIAIGVVVLIVLILVICYETGAFNHKGSNTSTTTAKPAVL